MAVQMRIRGAWPAELRVAAPQGMSVARLRDFAWLRHRACLTAAHAYFAVCRVNWSWSVAHAGASLVCHLP
eukprot:243218-Alexandrium_andersonii.AAC.1